MTIDAQIKKAIEEYTPEQLALGFLRYETMRKMSPTDYRQAWCASHRLDDIIDDQIKGRDKP